jgi:hypothetical protein
MIGVMVPVSPVVKSFRRLGVLLAALASLLGLAAAEPAPRAKVSKILFIGNSYTYFNNLPRLLEQLGNPDRQVVVEMIAEGGATLQDHWERGKAVKAIEKGGWDYVVLQDQSTLGVTYLVDGQPRITDPKRYFTWARRFHEVIRKSGARTVLFGHWARENAPREDWDALAFFHGQLGKELGAIVAPVGQAWQAVRQQDPELRLYQDDHSHPRPAGSYLAACVLHAACFGSLPADPPWRISGHPVSHEGEVDPKREEVLVELTPAAARTLRDAAAQAVRSWRDSGDNPKLTQPAPPRLPQVPRGRRPAAAELEGVWTGQTKMYPGGPNKMELRLTRVGGAWKAEGKVRLRGDAKDTPLEITDFQLTDEGISFTDANKKPHGGGVVKYRGAFQGDGLQGIAEIAGKEPLLYVIGSWQLRRQK